MSYSAGAQVEVDHKIVAASGDAAPTGGTYLPLFPNAKLNTRHLVAFDAFVTGPPITTGVFVGDGRTASTVVLGNNPNPTAPSFGFVGNPFITHSGDVVFQANASDVFTSDGRTVVPVVRNGDPAPGGGTLAPTGTLAANGHGAIVYLANISGSAATRGVFRSDGTQTVAIARDDNDAPMGGRFTSMFGRPVINDRGQVAFSAEMTGGLADFGVFLGDGAGLMPVFAANRVAPGGATFEDFGDPVINRHGQVAAFASLSNSASRGGLFIGAGTDAVAIALQGEAAPKGGSYREHDAFLGAIRLNDRGEVAFVARLTGGSSSSGIFRGNGDRTTTIALAGAVAPGTTGAFQSFDEIKLGIDGRVAFVATLEVGVGGVDASNNRGIWIGTSDEDLHLVVRTGDVIGGNVLTRLPAVGQDNQFDMNQNEVLWVGSFGPTTAIVVSRAFGGNDVVDDRFSREKGD
jgi:hypothetical protein